MTQIYGKLFDKNPLSESHQKVIDLIGRDKKVLELGCSTGYITKKLKANGCVVDVVEKDEDDAKKAKKYANRVIIGSIDDQITLKQITDQYNIVLAADILEHLQYPEIVLKKLLQNFSKNGNIIISLPNIASWGIRKDLFFKGKFDYQEQGILDRTHLKFFTYFTIQDFLKQNGYQVLKIHPLITVYPLKGFVLRFGILGRFLIKSVDSLLISFFPNLAAAHLVIKASPR